MASNKGDDEVRSLDISLRVDGGDIRVDAPETPPKLFPSPRGSDHYTATATDPMRERAVIIEGVQHKFMDPIFCHLERQIRGRVSWQDYDSVSNKLVIGFAQYEDAQTVLQLQRLKIENEVFRLRPLPDDYLMPSYLDNSYSFRSTQSEELYSLSQKLDTIKVFDVPEDLTTEDLELYFEDSLANGGPTKSAERIPEKRQAIIQYKESKDAVAVARKRIHSFMDHSMPVVLLESKLNLLCHAVQVSGIDWDVIKEEILKMYFRNKHRSGGGDILEIMPDKELGRAVITFASGKDAQNVVERGKTSGHNLSKVPLHVEIMNPWSSSSLLPAFEDETEQNRLIVKGLYFRITLSKLTEFVETVAGCSVVGWSLSSKQCSAMLEFDGEPDYKALRERVNCFPFCGHMIGIQKMPLTTFIQVSNLPPTETVDSVVNYFKVCIGDQPFLHCEQKTESSIILQFQRHSVVQGIHSGTHVLGGQTLKLDLWSKELGRLLPVNASRDPVENCPQMLKIRCTQLQLFCIQNSSFIREDIERKLRDNGCAVTWPSAAEHLDVRLQLAGNSLKESQLWPDKCRSLLQKCLADLFRQNFALTPDKWIKTKEIIQGNFGLICEFDERNCEVSVYGYSQSVKECVKRIKEMEDEIKRQEEEFKSRKSEPLTLLRPYQIQYLQVAGIVDEMKSLLPEVTVEASDQMFSLLGREEDFGKAKLHIYESLNNIDSRFIDLTESLTELITTELTTEFLMGYFEQNQVRVVIQRSREKPGIKIYGVENDLRNAEEYLISQFVESTVEANVAANDAMQSSEWPEFVNGLKNDYRFVIIKPTTDACIVACRSDLLDSVKLELVKMFHRYTIVELFFSLKQSHAKLLHRQVELQKSKLGKCTDGVEVRQDFRTDGTSGLVVKGRRREAEAVRDQLETVAKDVVEERLELNEPGVMTLMCSSEGKEFVKDLQNKDLIILKMVMSESTTALSTPSVHTCSEIEKGHEIILELGDIMRSSSGAIINPCNSFIHHSRGLGSEIVCRGGKGVEQEFIYHIKDCGILLPGHAFASKADKVFIIHVVEPVVFDESAVNIYKLAIGNVLAEAVRRNLDCIVFPLHFGVAFRRHLLFSTIKDFFQKNSTTALKIIKFCDNDVEVLVEFEKQFKHYELSVLAAGAAGGGAESSEAGAEFSVMTPEGVLVRLFEGSICDLKVDVIVNSTSKDLILGQGEISKTILTVAGSNIQKECKTNFPKGLDQAGKVIKTKSHKLTSCNAVYHGAAVKWDGDPTGECIKTLRTFVSEALKLADSEKVTSIAFPAVGSGTLKIPHDIVADVLLDEIFAFSKSSPNTSLKTIFTVAFDKTQPSVDAFKKKYKELEPKIPAPFDEDSQNAMRSRLLRTYNEKVSFTITSFSQRVMQEIQNQLKQFIDNALDQTTYPIENALTEEQLERIKFLQTIYCVRIALSRSEIIIEGLESDVIRATKEFRYIVNGS